MQQQEIAKSIEQISTVPAPLITIITVALVIGGVGVVSAVLKSAQKD